MTLTTTLSRLACLANDVDSSKSPDAAAGRVQRLVEGSAAEPGRCLRPPVEMWRDGNEG
jgi:hypothetical protein